jgi:hypothetical protein
MRMADAGGSLGPLLGETRVVLERVRSGGE